MADVTIGGQAWSVTLPNFKTLKAAWRYIAAVQASTDPMDSVEAILGIVSVGSSVAVTVDALEEALTPAEMPGLRPFLDALMIETGLASEDAVDDPLDPASLSTATLTPSSAPSSPASEAPTGMA